MAFSDLLPALLIFAYLAGLAIVTWVWGKMKDGSMEEFAVANRSFPWWLVMFTVLATWFPPVLYTGWFAWAGSGGAIAFYVAVYSVAAMVVYYAIAPRLWKWGKLHNLYNMPDFIRLRYNSRGLSIFMAVTAFVLVMPGTVTTVKSFGFLMNVATNGTIPFNIGMAVIVLFILGYVLLAGMRSVVVTDFVQGVIATVAIFGALLVIAGYFFGGYGAMVSEVFNSNPNQFTLQPQTTYWAAIILTGTIGAYGYLHTFNRIFVASSVKEVKKVTIAAPALALVLVFSVLLLGMSTSVLPDIQQAGQSALFVMGQTAGGPVLLAMLGIVVLAAGMSSLDSLLTTIGVIVSWNIVSEVVDGIDANSAVTVSRAFITVYILAVYAIATQPLPNLSELFLLAYEGTVQLSVPVILGIFWHRGNKYATAASTIVGIGLAGYINFFMAPSYGGPAIAGFTGGMVALVVNFLVYVGIALVTDTVEYVDELFEELEEYDGSDIDTVESRDAVLHKYDPLTTDD